MNDRIDTNVDIITNTIADHNRDALRRLTRVVTLSQGFSLSIVLCNYQVLQKRVLQDLRSQLADRGLTETAIAILTLEADAKTLLTPIQRLMEEVHNAPPEQKPKALMVLGLDVVKDIVGVLKSANQVREEFANCLEFPMILWLNDRTQDILTRDASDLANWTTAGAIEFQLEPVELKLLLENSTGAMFSHFLDARKQGFLHAPIANLLQQFELMEAVAELEAQGIVVDGELRASLNFAFGCIAFVEAQLDQAKELFHKSLAVWRSGNQLKQAVCLLQLGMCDRTEAFRHRYDKEPFYRTSQQYFAESIAIFRKLERWDLVGEYINFLMATMEELADREDLWQELEALANEALALRQTYPNQLREAHDCGILASVKLAEMDYANALKFAESALALYQSAEALKLPTLHFSERYVYGKYELWLARALAGLGDRSLAIARLEGVRDRWNHQYDAQIYVSVLEELRLLYTAESLYLKAFETKQHQRSVEQQYGLRAFIGAGTLNPKREANNPDMYTALSRQTDGIAQEIEASGRMPDVQKLVDRIRRVGFPLTVIHGDSGAGKSSILSGGVIPALQKMESIDGRKVLVLAVNTYKDWSGDIKRQLNNRFTTTRPQLDPIQHLKQNIDENYLTVLIFDQFEDFFFKKEDFSDRLPFYRFLKACLYIDFVQVVLSMREDYLHYLLEFDRSVKVKELPKDFEGDILGKQVRYYLGDFTQKQARQVIEILTKRAQVSLDDALIDRLVTDLSGDRATILPIELQVVGAQLEREDPPIVSRSQYLALTSDAGNKNGKPSEILVERWLENVVKDCGEFNQLLAERVLYALTGHEEKRPQKTQTELAVDLLTDNSESESNLSLVLAVLVGSGLAFRVSSMPDDRYQLIHDYLVSFIRKKYVFGMAEELRMTKEQLRSALVEKDRELQRAEIAELEAVSITCEAYWLAHKELDAMVAGLRAARRIFDPDIRKIVPNYTEGRTFGRLWEVIYNIHEANRLEGHSNGVLSVAFSPDGKTIASGSADNTIKLWNLEGKELRTLTGHSNGVWRVAFSPDGKTIAIGSDDNTIKLCNLEGKELLTLTGHINEVISVAFSPDGKTIASGSLDNTIKLWNLEGKELRTLTGHSNRVWSVAFSPDGKTIASGSSDNTIKLWNLEGKELRTLTGHSNWVWSVAFSPDGKTIASGSYDKSIKLWDIDPELAISQAFDWLRPYLTNNPNVSESDRQLCNLP